MWMIPAAKAYGGILLTRSGRILLREPANHYDGYVWTYPKGRSDAGEKPEETALREVREETGYEAEIVDVLPGVFKGGTSTNAFFVMQHIGPPGQFDARETASVRWADFDAAEALIGRTTNQVGRARDLAILQAARAWFRANESVVLPDDENLLFPARPYDCPSPIQPMPAQYITLPLDLALNKAEAANVCLGLVPTEQEQHWFACFSENTLYLHRSWTGLCIYRVHFMEQGKGLRTTHAEVNRDPEQYGCKDDAEDVEHIKILVQELANRDLEVEAAPSSLQQAIEFASQPNYLGSPETVASLLEAFFKAHEPGPTGLPDWAAKQAAKMHLTRVMCEDGTGYTRMPAWHTETALGQNLITAFNLDREYCVGESLFFIVSEALAALSMAIGDAFKALAAVMVEFDNPEDYEKGVEELQALFSFAVQSFIGTQMVMASGKTLRDFHSAGEP